MDRVDRDVHRPLCAFLDKRPFPAYGRDNRIIMLPRGWYKSSVATIGGCIQDILRNPGVTILVANEKVENSANFVRAMRTHFEKNRMLQWLFPEIIPKNLNKVRWSDSAFVVNRPEGHERPEATVEAIGVGGTVVSRHYDVIRLDDLIGKDAAMSPTIMHHAKQWMRLMEHLFSDTMVGQKELTGTRWAYDDIYRDALEDDTARRFILPGETDGVPNFPKRFPREELDRIKKHDGSYLYSCMILLNPISPENADFKESWLNYYEIDHESGDIVIRQGDKIEKLSRKQLYVAGMVDPATDSKIAESKTAFVSAAKDNKGRKFILDVWAKRSASPSDVCEALISRYKRFNHNKIGFETNIFQNIYKQMLQDMARRQGVDLPLVPMKAGKDGEKETRIRSMDGIFESGEVYIRRSMTAFTDEYLSFPMGREMDVLDATFYLLHQGGLLKYPDGRSYDGDAKTNKWHEDQLDDFRTKVNAITGYGA